MQGVTTEAAVKGRGAAAGRTNRPIAGAGADCEARRGVNGVE